MAILKRLGVCESITDTDRTLERLPALVAEFNCERVAEALARYPIDRSELAQELKVLLALRHRAIVFYGIYAFRQRLVYSGQERDSVAICEVKKKPVVLLDKGLNQGKD